MQENTLPAADNPKKVLILGGYGNFGKRIAENLSAMQNVTLFIAGRNADKADALCCRLRDAGAVADLVPTVLDIDAPDFAQQLLTLCPNVVIHTGGPFQGQDYRVPNACIAAGSHYIDLADGRRFVCDITELDSFAREKNVLVVSGASSVPGLSSAVIDQYYPEFSSLDSIDFAIAPGNQAERGYATVDAILSYTGHAFPTWVEGQWQQRYGWGNSRVLDFGSVIGRRPTANVDIPDLELFPARYSEVKTVLFQAGLELPILHYGMASMAWLARKKWVKNWANYTRPIMRASRWFERLGTDIGGMRIVMSGTDRDGQSLSIEWRLTATDGIGPYIPTLSAIILAKKLLSDIDALPQRGAMPCLGLFTVADFDDEALPLGITHRTDYQRGSNNVG